MSENFMREKPIFSLVISMSLPMVVSMLVNALYNIIDSYFVARISEEAMTALSLVFPVQNLVNSVGIGFGIGINAAISYYLGADKREKASASASDGMVLAIVHGLVMMLLVYWSMPRFLAGFTDSQNVIDLGVAYANMVFAFTMVVMFSMAYEKIFQAVGRMKVSMLCLLEGCVMNIILDPIFIFGLGPVPALGIRGAALATGLGQTSSLVLYLLIAHYRPMSICINRQSLHWEKALVGRLYGVGIPATLNMALSSVLITALNGTLAFYSGVYILILGIYYKLQTFLYLTANGIIQGMRPLVGFNYGAGEHERVQKIFNVVLAMVGVIMVIGTILFMAAPAWLMGLYTESADTIATGVTALRLISVGFVFSAMSVTASGALEGLGKGTASLVISLCRYTVLIIPLAFVLSRILGPVGVWHAFWVTEVITAWVALVVYRCALRENGASSARKMME